MPKRLVSQDLLLLPTSLQCTLTFKSSTRYALAASTRAVLQPNVADTRREESLYDFIQRLDHINLALIDHS
jgi:hypothetical protein